MNARLEAMRVDLAARLCMAEADSAEWHWLLTELRNVVYLMGCVL